MKLDEIFPVLGNVGTYALAAIQQNEVFQIIEFSVSILASLVIIAFRLWAWWKKAKEDGKITKEEIDEAIDIIESERKEGKDK